MRLDQLAMLNRLVAERDRLIVQRDLLTTGRGLAVQFNGAAFDATVHNLVRPVIVGEMNGRLRRIEADLKGLGVEI